MEDKARFVEDIVDKAMTHTRKIMEEVKSITSKYPEKNGDVYKDIAMKYKDHPYFSLIMAEARGREPNYTEVTFKKMNESLKNQQDKDLVCEKKRELSRIP
jgi:1,6-anhydro-N-acetylmuramate kinase